MNTKTRSGLIVGLVTLVAAIAANAQTEDEGPIYTLSPFEVSTDSDVGYLSTNSTSGTSLNIAIKDLPMAVQVINKDQITDLGASNLDEALLYSAGVFTDDNQASNSVGATRGTQGGGSGDKSISSAGQGSRFANVVHIRGLSTPYQNRMGFRYGGLVVTPDSEVALGGLMDSVNMERVEVVKGPNSLLYGVGVLTGIVNVIPERPLPEPRYEFSTKMGSYDFLRLEADLTGPLKSDWIPGQLNYRLAGSFEERGHWTDFRSNQTEYYVAQLEYTPFRKARLFLEYQDGNTRDEGIASQWIYDEVNAARDSEFRNEFDEAFNWARYDGTLGSLRKLDSSDGSIADVSVFDNNTGTSSTQGALRILDTPDAAFTGGGLPNSYRITGPDTFAERDEQNFIADLELTPIENLTINLGAFLSEQETEELTIQFNSGSITSTNIFAANLAADTQFKNLYENGGIYAVQMQDAVKSVFDLDLRVDPVASPGNWALTQLTDDAKFTEYWWRRSIVKSTSQQYRFRTTYSFEADLLGSPAKHTFLAGINYIKDDIDFPNGGVDEDNARANQDKADTFPGYAIGSEPDSVRISEVDPSDTTTPTYGQLVNRPLDQDGLYLRSIANFEPIYFDGRNDGVSEGYNVVRAGDTYLNQVIEQTGMFGVYQGQFFNNKVNLILGARQDIYNARQKTYKRVNVTDDFLRSGAMDVLQTTANATANNLFGTGSSAEKDEFIAAYVADRTQTDTFIANYYESAIEGEREGYYGYANRGGEPDANYGIVPGSEFDIFEKDVNVTTGTFGLNFAINDRMTIYGVVAQGISPNTALRDGAGEIIPAEETLNKEVGLKFDFLGGKLSGNISVFEINRENAIWDLEQAPAPSKWVDARLSPNRSDEWTIPTYDPETPTTYFVREDYMQNYLGEAFGIDPSKLKFAQIGDQIQQTVSLQDLDPNLTIFEKLTILRDVGDKTLFPRSFANQSNSQAPLGGAVQIKLVGIKAEGLDELQDVTLFNPETSEFLTLPVSNLNILYSAFMDREVDKTKNDILQEIHPIRYRRFTSFGQPQGNNNLSMNESQGALVIFDETINGFEFELFFTPTPNLQFVFGYTHIEREADNTFTFVDWDPLTDVGREFGGPFTMLHREYGWEQAGIQAAWVNAAAYEAALSGGDGVVAASDLEGSMEMIDADMVDQEIASSEFAARNAAGELLLFVDDRGNIINEANDARATDYRDILSGVSLNFNPEDEFSAWARYSFTEDHGFLDGMSVNLGFKYIGRSATSVAFNSVSPLAELSSTPEVGERLRFDLGASYKFEWQDIMWRLSINVYDVLEDTYDVTVKSLGVPNPITGETVTKRTEKFYSPTTVRIGLTANF